MIVGLKIEILPVADCCGAHVSGELNTTSASMEIDNPAPSTIPD
jgi:hypothetical protein